MKAMIECPVCGFSEYAHFIDAVGQCGSCESGEDAEDCYHLDGAFPDHSDDMPDVDVVSDYLKGNFSRDI